MSQMKAQAEIIIVLGVIIVAVVVALFATKTINLLPPEPESVSVLKASLRTDIERAVSVSLHDIVKKVAANGGYLDLDKDPKPPVLDYSGSKVAYWQYANLTLVRSAGDIEQTIAKGLKDSLKLDPNSFQSVKGKDVKIEAPRSVEIKIKENEVTAKVDLPVSVEGYGLDSAIEVKTSSILGKAISFANELITKTQQKGLEYKQNDETGNPTDTVIGSPLENRYFERFAVDAMRKYSEVDELGSPKIPTEGVLTGCETPPLSKSWNDIQPEMQSLLSGILENTYTAGKVPRGISNSSRYPAYALPVFTDLDTKFYLGKSLDAKSFQLFQNNSRDPSRVYVETVNFGYTTTCISPPYRVIYFLLYPIVAEVGDGNEKFRFAIYSYINGYAPGDYKNLGVVLNFYEEDLARCQQASCPVKITVGDGTAPVKDAKVSYGYCDLGTTNQNGLVEAKAPCGIYPLEIWDKDHKTYSKLISSDNIKETSILLSKLSQLKIHTYNLQLVNNSGIYKVSDVKLNADQFTLTLTQTENKPISLQTETGELVANQIPRGEDVGLTTTIYKGTSFLGGAVSRGVIPESSHDIWVYNPTIEGLPQDQNSAFSAMIALTNISVECGKKIGASLPISPVALNADVLKTCAV